MKRTLALAALFATLTAGTALALPYNDRPGDIAPKPSSGSEPTLQNILNANVTGPSGATNYYNAVTSQSTAALWNVSDKNSSTFLINLYAAHSDGALGIYSPNGQEYALLSEPAGTAATFSIVNGNLRGANNALLVKNFGTVFGFFWLDAAEGYRSYTEDTKNGGTAMALTYRLLGGSSVTTMVDTSTGETSKDVMQDGDDWIMAFEDHPDGDFDYNDAIFLVKDISAVPEPGTMMLLGAGFLGLAIYGKRRRNA